MRNIPLVGTLKVDAAELVASGGLQTGAQRAAERRVSARGFLEPASESSFMPEAWAGMVRS
jgi:hypothetical protein